MDYVCKSMNNMNLYKQLQKMSVSVLNIDLLDFFRVIPQRFQS